MSRKRYKEPENYVFSVLYGGGIYEIQEKQRVTDPLGIVQQGYESPLLKNILTGELFYARRFPYDELSWESICRKVIIPCDRTRMLWPGDVVFLNENQAGQIELLLAQKYNESLPEEAGSYAYLFPYCGPRDMLSLEERFERIPSRNWTNPEVRKLTYRLLETLNAVNEDGYVFEDFHSSRILFDTQDEVFLDFSNLLFSYQDTLLPPRESPCTVKEGDYPIEYAEPALVNRKQFVMDYQTQNYSLSALLFHLLFHHYAYDGPMLTGELEAEDSKRRFKRFQQAKYHNYPLFIFDPADTRNALSDLFTHDRELLDLWEECPELLREMFIQSLKGATAQRSGKEMSPAPADWMRAYEAVGWDEGVR